MASQLYARIPTYSISHLITVSSVPALVDLVCSLLRREMKGDPFFFFHFGVAPSTTERTLDWERVFN